MYLRLTILAEDADSHRPRGIFQAGWNLLDSGDLSAAEADDLRNLLLWFNDNMPCPTPNQRRTLSHRALFWFKPGARRYLPKARELAQLLRQHGLWVETQKTHHPGSIVYADACQVAAIPGR